jgi:hypothetical protein
MVLLRWSVGAVGAGSVPGGAVGGARFGVLLLGDGRVPSRDCVGRGKVPVAGESFSMPFSCDYLNPQEKKEKNRERISGAALGTHFPSLSRLLEETS